MAQNTPDVQGGGITETILQDVRYGVRVFLKHRAFSLVAILGQTDPEPLQIVLRPAHQQWCRSIL